MKEEHAHYYAYKGMPTSTISSTQGDPHPTGSSLETESVLHCPFQGHARPSIHRHHRNSYIHSHHKHKDTHTHTHTQTHTHTPTHTHTHTQTHTHNVCTQLLMNQLPVAMVLTSPEVRCRAISKQVAAGPWSPNP